MCTLEKNGNLIQSKATFIVAKNIKVHHIRTLAVLCMILQYLSPNHLALYGNLYTNERTTPITHILLMDTVHVHHTNGTNLTTYFENTSPKVTTASMVYIVFMHISDNMAMAYLILTNRTALPFDSVFFLDIISDKCLTIQNIKLKQSINQSNHLIESHSPN